MGTCSANSQMCTKLEKLRIATPENQWYLFSFSLLQHHTYDMEQQTKFFVSLLKSVQEGLKSSKMFKHFVNSEDSQNFQESNDFASFSNNFNILQTLQKQRDVERYETNKIHNIHRLDEKLNLVWRHNEAGKVFKGKEGDSSNIYSINNLEQN